MQGGRQGDLRFSRLDPEPTGGNREDTREVVEAEFGAADRRVDGE